MNIFQRILAAAATFALLTGITACRNEQPAEPTDKKIEIHEAVGPDSVNLTLSLTLLPNAQANLRIAEVLSEEMGGTYQGSYADLDSMARHYADSFKKDIAETRGGNIEADIPFERCLSVKKEWENDSIVTYVLNSYSYEGGAHGSDIVTGLSFRKSDGRRLGSNMLNAKVCDEMWNEWMLKGLIEATEVSTKDELLSNLEMGPVFSVPLPQSEPYFTEEGLTFLYQQYEIAPYAAGTPSFTIPYALLPRYLNVTGQRAIAGMQQQ